MLTILIIIASGALAYITINQIMNRNKIGESINLEETLLSEEDIHTEIAKTIETIKSQDPVVIETPFVSAKAETKPAKKTTAKKTTAKKKVVTKKPITKKSTKK